MKDNDQEREWDNHRAGHHPAYVEKIMASWQRINGRFRACPADGSDCYQCGEVCMKRRGSEYPFYNPPFQSTPVNGLCPETGQRCENTGCQSGCVKGRIAPEVKPPSASLGWICPVCERGVSPLFAVCPCASLPADPSTDFRIV